MDSKLQIISGKFRGKKLHLPPNARPTQNKARIALFNMLDNILRSTDNGLRITAWDAFAGSGAFGIEFLSREWASRVIFTDIDTKTVEKNLAPFDAGTYVMRKKNAMAAIADYAPHVDIVFVDPPWDAPKMGEKFVREFASHARPGTIIIWETEIQATAEFENLSIIKDKQYGRARFLILEKRDSDATTNIT